MPFKMRKVSKKNCFKVYKQITKKSGNKTRKVTGKVFSKCATKENAMKQLRLLRAIQFNKDFVPRNSRRSMNMSLNKTRKNSK